jgi:hypothetical protein
MNRENLKKRLVKIDGAPLVSLTPYRKEQRREVNKVSSTEESENVYDDFFDFEKDLDDSESARKQFERMEEERLQREKANDFLTMPLVKESFVVFDEIEEPETNEDFDLYKRVCKSTKKNGEPCKSLAMVGSDFCKSHSAKL